MASKEEMKWVRNQLATPQRQRIAKTLTLLEKSFKAEVVATISIDDFGPS